MENYAIWTLVCVIGGMFFRKLSVWRGNFKIAKTAQFPTFYSPQVISMILLNSYLIEPLESILKIYGGLHSKDSSFPVLSCSLALGLGHGFSKRSSIVRHDEALTHSALLSYGDYGMLVTSHSERWEAIQ